MSAHRWAGRLARNVRSAEGSETWRGHGDRVSVDYYDRAPFPFNGTINNVNVRYTS
jgi:hypothetical protein